MKYFLRKAFWGQKILALLDHELRKVINRNTVKASDSTMPNMEYNAKMWKKKMQRSGECSFKSLKAANFTVHLKKKRQLNAFHMKIHLQIHSPLRWSGEMPKNATNANMPSLALAIWGDLWKSTMEKQMQLVLLCFFPVMLFEDTYEKHRHRRNVTSYHFLNYFNFHQ